MSGNSKSLIGKMGSMAATVSPADFEIGSPESRAAARAIAQKRRELSQEDEDCLTLYNSWPSIHFRVAGHEATGFRESATKGMEISKRRDGPIIPSHLDPHEQRTTSASIQFEMCFDREPVPGDILTREDIEARYSETMLYLHYEMSLRPAWERRTPEAPFPFKIENGKAWVLSLNDKREPVWEVSTSEDPEFRWKDVAEEALFGDRCMTPLPYAPWEKNEEWKAIEAVKFIEPFKGKHCCKPCKANERTDKEGYASTVARIAEILDDVRKRASSAEIAEQLGS